MRDDRAPAGAWRRVLAGLRQGVAHTSARAGAGRQGQPVTILRGLGCASLVIALPTIIWATNLASLASSNLCHSATSAPVVQGVAYPASKSSFLPGGEAAPVGPGHTVMDFAAHFWYPPGTQSAGVPGTGDTVELVSPTLAEYRFQGGTVVGYRRAPGAILCETTVLSGLGITGDLFLYLGGSVVVLALLFWVALPRWPLPVAIVVLALCAFIWHLVLNVDVDGTVAPRGLLFATAVFAALVTLVAGALHRTRRRQGKVTPSAPG